jgi:hypothetical protein
LPASAAEASRPNATRDDDLRDADRLQLSLDTDLDLLTSMQLELTAAGRTRDAIDGHLRWHPDWYVASHRGRQSIDFEIAVLRRDVADLPIHAGQRWFVNVRSLSAGQVSPWRAVPQPADWQSVVFR